jgi:AbrB family looped-hinge helix DNA binding protein
MARVSVKMNSRYRISIPKQVRKSLKIKIGDRLLVDVQDGMVILLPEPRSYTRLLGGLYQEVWENSSK